MAGTQASMLGADPPLHGVRLEADRVEVRLTRSAVKARLFGRAPEATRIGRFVVLERVGMGGMGIVYAAYDPQLDRRVALKVMRDDVVRSRRPARQRMLLREARAMARVSHPNVVAVYDAGTVDGQVFVAMEFVRAPTLRRWLEQPRAVDERLRVMLEAGQGLATAHAAGLVHRDFKPENVLVPDDAAVRVTDFGLARAVGSEDASRSGAVWSAAARSSTALTLGWAGTPAYMSPEQLRADAVDARADQWAFCVVLYEVLAGVRPFEADVLAAMAEGHAVTCPPLPDGAAGPRVRAVIERGLSHDPGQRFEGMAELLEALRPPRRSRATWGLVALGVGLASLGAVVLGMRRPQPPTCPRASARMAGVWDDATRDRIGAALREASPGLGADTWARVQPALEARATRWLDLRQEGCRAHEGGEMSDELLDLRMACLDARHGELRALVDTLAQADAEIVAHAVESTVRLAPLSSCTDPRVLRALMPPPPAGEQREAVASLRASVDHARALRRSGKTTAARPVVEAAVVEAEALGDPGLIIEARLERGHIRAELADREGAAADFDAVIEQGGRVRYLGAVIEAAVALVDLVGVDQARVEAGLDVARMASVAVALGGGSELMRARLQLARGRVLYLAGRTEEGLGATRDGMRQLEQLDDDERAQLERAGALRLIAKLALARDDYDEAREHARQALVIYEELLGPEHPEVADTLAHAAAAALRAGEIEAAREGFERAAEIQLRAYGDRHPLYGRTVLNLGTVIQAGGDRLGARRAIRQAVDVLEASLGVDDPRVAVAWVNLGGVEADLEHYDAAEQAYQRALEGLRASMGERHPQTALALANLGRLQLLRGDVAAAIDSLRRSLEIREQVLGPDHTDTGRSHHALGEALAAAGEDAAAIEAYRTAEAVMIEARAPALALARVRGSWGRLAWTRGERGRARALFEQAWPGLEAEEIEEIEAMCGARCRR